MANCLLGLVLWTPSLTLKSGLDTTIDRKNNNTIFFLEYFIFIISNWHTQVEIRLKIFSKMNENLKIFRKSHQISLEGRKVDICTRILKYPKYCTETLRFVDICTKRPKYCTETPKIPNIALKSQILHRIPDIAPRFQINHEVGLLLPQTKGEETTYRNIDT